jgi:hypothetical protein
LKVSNAECFQRGLRSSSTFYKEKIDLEYSCIIAEVDERNKRIRVYSPMADRSEWIGVNWIHVPFGTLKEGGRGTMEFRESAAPGWHGMLWHFFPERSPSEL